MTADDRTKQLAHDLLAEYSVGRLVPVTIDTGAMTAEPALSALFRAMRAMRAIDPALTAAIKAELGRAWGAVDIIKIDCWHGEPIIVHCRLVEPHQ